MSALDARSRAALARVNGVPVNHAAELLAPGELRQRVCTELLRQQAIACGLLAVDDAPPAAGVISECAAAAIETLLERELAQPEPDEATCRRHHAANAARYTTGERVRLRHVLFAVTPGVDVNALRERAEACLIDLRASGRKDADARFAAAARELSNCPSGADGGELGWLRASDCAPEFAHEVFGHPGVGVAAHLVHSRFGLHVVEVQERAPGIAPPFEAVRGAVAQSLRQQAFATALRGYLQQLAGAARIEGIDLDADNAPGR